MSLNITIFYTAIFALLVVPLSLIITHKRIVLGNLAYGDGNDMDLRRKIETLGNFSEYVPLGLFSLACLEHLYGASFWVALLGGIFLLCRLCHALGMLFASTPSLRAVAMMGQHAYFVLISIFLIFSVIN